MKTPMEKVLEVVDRYEERHNGFWCICPAHDDHNPSLHIQEGNDGRALIICRTGCDQEQVMTALEARGLNRGGPVLRDNRRRPTRQARQK